MKYLLKLLLEAVVLVIVVGLALAVIIYLFMDDIIEFIGR